MPKKRARLAGRTVNEPQVSDRGGFHGSSEKLVEEPAAEPEKVRMVFRCFAIPECDLTITPNSSFPQKSSFVMTVNPPKNDKPGRDRTRPKLTAKNACSSSSGISPETGGSKPLKILTMKVCIHRICIPCLWWRLHLSMFRYMPSKSGLSKFIVQTRVAHVQLHSTLVRPLSADQSRYVDARRCS